MKYTKKDAVNWIEKQETGFSRNPQEAAKYLVAKLVASELPHIALWNEVLKISRGF